MSTLAFDTATRATAVALCRDGEEVLEARDDPGDERPRHASQVLSLAAEVLERAGLGWSELTRIAVGIGPGTFTGLRIGVASARALAQARGIPVVGVSTLASLAVGAREAAREAGCEAVVAVIDARRGEAFAAAWPVAAKDGGAAALALGEDAQLGARAFTAESALLRPAALTPEALAETVRALGSSVLATGDGAVRFRGVLERSGALIAGDGSELHRVSARHHCLLARQLPDGDSEHVFPEYLRAPDAEPSPRLSRHEH